MRVPVSVLYLAAAIGLEVVGTLCLKPASTARSAASLWLLTLGFYGGAFYCLSLALRTIPVGVAYAVWSGVGTVLIALIGWIVFRQRLDWPALTGIALIVSGIALLSTRPQAQSSATAAEPAPGDSPHSATLPGAASGASDPQGSGAMSRVSRTSGD